MSARCSIVRRAEFRALPWKNGGGITHELMRVPPAGERFAWRVSVAQIEASGPFSDFAGYQRTMVLLRGNGMRLEFADGSNHELQRAGEWLEFDGALVAHCDLLDGPCSDLNLMVDQAMQAHAGVQRLERPLQIQAATAEIALIFALDAPLALELQDGETWRLEPWELAVLTDTQAIVRGVEAAKSDAPGTVFFANMSN